MDTRLKSARKGSITLEATIILPIFIICILGIVSIFKIVIVWNNVQYSLDKTASVLSDYAVVYHENGVSRISDEILQKVFEYIDPSVISSDITKYLDARKLVQNADDVLYSSVTKVIFNYFYSQNIYGKATLFSPEALDDVNFAGSIFYNNSDDVILKITYKVKTSLPIPNKIISGYRLSNTVHFRAWLKGEVQLLKATGENIWDLDNFSRGVTLREKYGGNLPENFPVIAKFDKGEAIMIKSLDFTDSSYSNSDTLTITLKNMSSKLASFEGVAKPWGKEAVLVRQSEIKVKVIRLIIPENDMTQEQRVCFNDFQKRCSTCGIKLDLIRYQSS